MISVAAHRIKQYGVEFYQASFSAREIDRLVKFEVLGYTGGPNDEGPKKKAATRSRVNWDILEMRINESETAYQRPRDVTYVRSISCTRSPLAAICSHSANRWGCSRS